MSGKPSGHAARDCLLILLGFLCASPLLLLPAPSGLPRATWSDASHVHSGGMAHDSSVQQLSAALAEGPAPAAAAGSSARGMGADSAADSGAAAPGTGFVPISPRLQHICRDSDPIPPPGVHYDVMGEPGSSAEKWPQPVCHWALLRHPAVPLQHFNVCTHDPATDKVISTFLHQYGFWDAPETYNTLLAAGPCTADRPFSLDIGANLGLWTLVSAVRGCRVVAFEPLSQNILRIRESLRALGLEQNVRLYKHAVGKKYGEVSINFFASNPGASAIGASGANVEKMGSITVDGLLLGDKDKAPSFPGLPPFIGRHIAWAKIDTEGWDVAVVDGALRTLIGGQVPLIMIEFTPSDAAGTAGCDPIRFVQLMYGNGYRMYHEGGRVARLASLVKREIPKAKAGVGARVFEVFFIHDNAAVSLMQAGVLQPFDSASAAADALIEPWKDKAGL